MQYLKKETITIFLTTLFLCGCSVSSSEGAEAPRVLLALGRLHPLILHLPIGALVLAFFLDIYGRIKNNYPKEILKIALGFSAISAIFACIFGYFLSLEGGYTGAVLDTHFYAGIVTAILACVLYFLIRSNSNKVKPVFLPLFVLTMVSITVAGHYGSILTHGDNFLTEYLQPEPETKAITNIDDLQMYDDVILKIFDEKCIQCHNPSKTKGDLSLATTESILKGGESGAVIQLGDASNSLLFKSLMLPISDEQHMPPEGKPQLSKDEIELIKFWLNHSEVNPKVATIEKNDTISSLLKKFLVFNQKEIPPASIDDIQEVESNGFLVRRLTPKSPKLWVKFPKDTISEDAMESLSGLQEQIVELDLKNVLVDDDMLRVVKNFENLEKLELGNTLVSDKSLKYLENSKSLNVLNLVGTKVTEKGLDQLLTQITPQHIYLWKTDIGVDAIAALEEKYKIGVNAGIPNGFVEVTKLEMPSFITQKSLFLDTLTIAVKERMKGTKYYYTLNGIAADSTSTLYQDPFVIDSTTKISIRAYKKGWEASDLLETTFYKMKYDVVDYTIAQQPEKQYSGTKKLFDKELGSENFKDSKWLGFLGKDCNATVNLGDVKTLDRVTVSCMGKQNDWILFPKEIEVFASNSKNTGFRKVGELKLKEDNQNDLPVLKSYHVTFPKTEAQYFRIVVNNGGPLPKWHPGSGNPSWIFIDEIIF